MAAHPARWDRPDALAHRGAGSGTRHPSRGAGGPRRTSDDEAAACHPSAGTCAASRGDAGPSGTSS